MRLTPLDSLDLCSMSIDLDLPVPSPCIGVCRMSRRLGLCEGCKRNLDEIARWSVMTDDEKLIVWQQLPARPSAGLDGSDGE